MNITLEMPFEFLLQLAVHGNMGDGDLPDLISVWARRILTEKGYSEELKEKQLENIKRLRSSLKNTLGNDFIKKMDDTITEVVQGLQLPQKIKEVPKQ